MKLRTLLPAGILLLLATPLAAQSVLAPGMRVRVSVPVVRNSVEGASFAAWETGTIKSVDSTALVLQTGEAEEIDIPLSVIRRIEVSEGRMTSSEGWRDGARKGAIAGGGVVLTLSGITLVTRGLEDPDCSKGSCREPFFLPMTKSGMVRNLAIATAAGAGLGVLFGSRAEERWTAVNLDVVEFAIGGDMRGTGVSLSLRF